MRSIASPGFETGLRPSSTSGRFRWSSSERSERSVETTPTVPMVGHAVGRLTRTGSEQELRPSSTSGGLPVVEQRAERAISRDHPTPWTAVVGQVVEQERRRAGRPLRCREGLSRRRESWVTRTLSDPPRPAFRPRPGSRRSGPRSDACRLARDQFCTRFSKANASSTRSNCATTPGSVVDATACTPRPPRCGADAVEPLCVWCCRRSTSRRSTRGCRPTPWASLGGWTGTATASARSCGQPWSRLIARFARCSTTGDFLLGFSLAATAAPSRLCFCARCCPHLVVSTCPLLRSLLDRRQLGSRLACCARCWTAGSRGDCGSLRSLLDRRQPGGSTGGSLRSLLDRGAGGLDLSLASLAARPPSGGGGGRRPGRSLLDHRSRGWSRLVARFARCSRPSGVVCFRPVARCSTTGRRVVSTVARFARCSTTGCVGGLDWSLASLAARPPVVVWFSTGRSLLDHRSAWGLTRPPAASAGSRLVLDHRFSSSTW